MNVEKFAKKYGSSALLGFGIAGLISSGVLAVINTKKYLEAKEAKKKELKMDILPGKETTKILAKYYAPSVALSTISVACLIGSKIADKKQQVALASAYALSESAFETYRSKVRETLGEKSSDKVDSAITEEKIKANPPPQSMIVSEGGATLFYESWSGRYFKSTIEKVKAAVNEFNRYMMTDMGYLPINEWYAEIGLDTVEGGFDYGWNVRDGLMDIKLMPHLTADNVPAVAIEYCPRPSFTFAD